MTASLMVPVPIRANVPAVVKAPTWERLLDDVGGTDPRLRAWVHELVFCPTKPQQPLLLTGAETETKTVFHEAIGLLLPRNSIVLADCSDLEHLPIRSAAWLMVLTNCSHFHVASASNTAVRSDHGRYLKWLLTQIKTSEHESPHVTRFQVRTPGVPNLIRHLENERGAFRRALKYAA